MLQRAHDLAADPPLSAGPDAFDDDNGSVHEPAINGLAAVGIAQGTGNRTFGPDSSVRRDQTASFVIRALEHLTG